MTEEELIAQTIELLRQYSNREQPWDFKQVKQLQLSTLATLLHIEADLSETLAKTNTI